MATIVKAFISGFAATLVFHQGLVAALNAAGVIPFSAFNMRPVGPLAIPSVLSLAFFGGLWGILIWKLVCRSRGASFWIKSILFGAIGPSAVAFLVVFPLKGIPVKLDMIPMGLLLNGAWGFGNSLFMKLFKEKK